jgi:hypothetical protein
VINRKLIVALGISAVDMLCCAMVAALVLFLVFASQRTVAKNDGARTTAERTLHIAYKLEPNRSIIVLRMKKGQAGSVDFWSDIPEQGFVRDSKKRDPLVEPSGYAYASMEPHNGIFDLVVGRLNGDDWELALAYADTQRDLAAEASSTTEAKVTLEGICTLELLCKIPLGEAVNLGSACQTTSDSGGCTVKRLLGDASGRPVQP